MPAKRSSPSGIEIPLGRAPSSTCDVKGAVPPEYGAGSSTDFPNAIARNSGNANSSSSLTWKSIDCDATFGGSAASRADRTKP